MGRFMGLDLNIKPTKDMYIESNMRKCPFCGGTPKWRWIGNRKFDEEQNDFLVDVFIECETCSVRTSARQMYSDDMFTLFSMLIDPDTYEAIKNNPAFPRADELVVLWNTRTM